MRNMMKSMVAGLALAATAGTASALTLDYKFNDAGLPNASYATVEINELENGDIRVDWALTRQAFAILGNDVGFSAVGFNLDDSWGLAQVLNNVTDYTSDWTVNFFDRSFGAFGEFDVAIDQNNYNQDSPEYLTSYGFTVQVEGDSIETYLQPNADGLNIYGAMTLGNFDFQGITSANIATSAAQPVPVPAALWLFGTGLMGLAASSRRRRAA